MVAGESEDTDLALANTLHNLPHAIGAKVKAQHAVSVA